MKLTSPVFYENTTIPPKYTCDGENINPPLTISDVPEDTISLALIVDDPDAVSGTFVHWTVWNIDPTITEIKENSIPGDGFEGATSAGHAGYCPPCPPFGTHRYCFKLYAIDTRLDPDVKMTKEKLEAAMKNHVLAKAELMGVYARKR